MSSLVYGIVETVATFHLPFSHCYLETLPS
jgi:hypothetical protein